MRKKIINVEIGEWKIDKRKSKPNKPVFYREKVIYTELINSKKEIKEMSTRVLFGNEYGTGWFMNHKIETTKNVMKVLKGKKA